jgi:non-ribosomal peptide synthase protein (TIGR01720 family)
VSVTRAGLPATSLEPLRDLLDAATTVQSSLDLASGPLFRAAVLDRGPGDRRLLLVAHHLVVDGVSWRIILEDLDTAYRQVSSGQPPQLPAKTSSFKALAERLQAWAGSADPQADLPYWEAVGGDTLRPLPRDMPAGVNAVATTRTVSTALSTADTGALLRKVPARFHTEVNAALLCALALACSPWTGSASLLVALEGHGRDVPFDDVDVSRTVGWFTSLFPVDLDLGGVEGTEQALRAVQDRLRSVPHRGLSYGVLRYLTHAGASLAAQAQPEISFNYLGQFGSATAGPEMATLPQDDAGPLRSPKAVRRYLLDVNGSVVDGQLRFDWWYCESIHRRSTVEALAERFAASLRAIVGLCDDAAAPLYTPTDFPRARVSQHDLDTVLARIRGGQPA